MTHDDELDRRVARALAAMRRDEPPAERAVESVLARVRERPRPRRAPRSRRGWLVGTGSLAVAAGLVLALALPRIAEAPHAARETAARPTAPADAQPVSFSLDVPGVSRVAVAGDFSNWRPVELRRVDGSARWTVTLPIRAGRYTYAFVVDGVRWVADPVAPVAPDADFGTGGSVLVVEGQRDQRTGGAS